ncbi:hypothetical protein ASG89_31980 [Paenibacillus sp. Soil766]|uniref:hypothetical protein n=1 Tax=Paenibacillus sp. Soil766 TaxID=1736404 RepID=UPI00070A8881|nr:hypothetical protein [Paenibacillus sp. Soil766]KRE94912.1 hypothetical protein ASG89_31980 [Paenibacillus sp. Soil766]
MISNSYKQRKYLLYKASERLKKSDLDKVFCHFGGVCPFTGEYKKNSYDHFIPLAWGTVVLKYGIGGHTYANMIMLSLRLNISKRSTNPFEWYRFNGKRLGIQPSKWKELVNHVARKHKMTPEEYERRVYACHEEVKAIEWMESVNSWVRTFLKKGECPSSPYSLIRSALWDNFNIAVVVETYGSDDAKKLLNSDEFKQIISECKAGHEPLVKLKILKKERKQ